MVAFIHRHDVFNNMQIFAICVSHKNNMLHVKELEVELDYRTQGHFFKDASFEWLGGSPVALIAEPPSH